MRKLLVIILLSVSSMGICLAQESGFTIEASQAISSFMFKNSDDAKLNSEYQPIVTGGYGVGYRYLVNDNILLRGGVGMRNGGASLVYDDMKYSWKLQYVDLKLGGGYMYQIGKLSPYLMVSGYYGYMLTGTQIINNEDFNITDSGSLKRSDLGIIVAPGVNFEISDFVTAYFEYNYLAGMKNIEITPDQTAKNRTSALTLGLSFTIK